MKEKVKITKEMDMGLASARKSKIRKFMKASGKMISDMAKELNLLKVSKEYSQRHMMENGKTTKEQAKEFCIIIVKKFHTSENLRLERRVAMENSI